MVNLASLRPLTFCEGLEVFFTRGTPGSCSSSLLGACRLLIRPLRAVQREVFIIHKKLGLILTFLRFLTVVYVAASCLMEYAYLERLFHIPDVDLTGLPQASDWVAPAAPGLLPDHHAAAQVGDDSDIMSMLPRGTILAEVEYADQQRFDDLVSKYETYN